MAQDSLSRIATRLTRKLAVETRSLSALRQRKGNARTHSKKQLRLLADSIRRFGFTAPILVDQDGSIITGHGRFLAAGMAGLNEVPTICIADLTPTEIKALAIADNRIAELAEWDYAILKQEIEELEFDEIELTGFDPGHIDQILDFESQDPKPTKGELEPGDLEGRATARLGDKFKLGDHFVSCGDARDESTYKDLLGARVAQMVFTDPPYNVAIDGHVSGLGQVKHREFAMAAGEMDTAQFIAFLSAVFARLIAFSANGSIHYVCMDWRHLRELLEAGQRNFAEMKNLCVWAKTNAGMGSFYRSQHELIAVFKNGVAKHINNFGLGESGRHRSNLWTYPGMTALTRERLEELKLHPTVKPVALMADAIRDCSKRGDVILDPFGGSGTTVIAAELTGRRAYTIELDPLYVDTAIRRWQRLTGEIATRVADGARFSDLEGK